MDCKHEYHLVGLEYESVEDKKWARFICRLCGRMYLREVEE